jgi:hypothetical protein
VGRNSPGCRNCRRKLCHPHYLSALLHARRLQDDTLLIYPCRFCHYLHIGHMKPPLTPHQKKKLRLERKICQVRKQLAQLRQNLQRLLEQEAQKPDAPKQSPGALPPRF